MTRFSTFLMALCLAGCGGGEFSGNSLSTDVAGTSSVGDAGETSVGGADSPSSGGSDAKGGSSAGTETGGSSDLGGSAASTGGDPGTAGSMMTGGTGGTMAGSGGSNMAGTGGTPPVMVCNPKATQCANGDFQTCKNDGSAWTTTACDFVCDPKKGCEGSCTPGDKKCDGLESQTCDETGAWVTTTTCSFVCGGKGVCSGSCTPGTEQCSSTNAQTCNDKGAWETTEACQFLCNFTNGSATCSGSCTNGTKQCSSKVPQTCTNGEWTSGAQCPFICSNGTCGGECVPGTQKCGGQGGVQTCSPGGIWLAEGAPCPFICSNGTCGGVCVPNAACADDGNACTMDVCNAQGTACTHPNKTNGAACGSSSSSVCDSPDSCQNGACQQNFKAPSVACTDDGNTCTTDTCNGTGSCTHPAAPSNTVCRAASCSNGVVTASATCGGATSCPSSTTSSCFGACDANGLTCQDTAPTKIEDVYNFLATDNDANYLYVSTRSQAGVSQIVRYTKSDNSKIVLFESSDSNEWIYSLIVTGGFVYFGETGQVSRITTSGVKQAATFIQGVSTFGFAKNSTDVYWNDGGSSACSCASPPSHHVYSVPLGGTSVTTFALPFNGVEVDPDMEATDTDLYIWTMYPYGAPWIYTPVLTRYSLTDPFNTHADLIPGYYTKAGNVTVETRGGSTLGNFPGLTKNGTQVFANVYTNWGDVGNGEATVLFSFKIADDTRKLLAVAGSSNFPKGDVSPSWNFVADSTYVYYDNKRVAVGGGSLAYWINHQLANPTLTMDASSLYFGSYGYWTSQPYGGALDVQNTALFKVAKP